MTLSTTPPTAPTSRRAASAFGWSFLNTGLSRLGTLAIGVVLARVLGPEEFGTFAVALVVMAAVLSCNELGVSLAIVRWEGDPGEIAGTVTTLSLATSAVLCGAVVFSAPAVAAALGDPQAAAVVQLMALSVVLSGGVATPAALMQREFQQRRRLVIDQVVTWSGAAISVVLAFQGHGAWSLAYGRVIGAAIGVVLFVAFSPRPYRLGWDAKVARRLLVFGLPLAGASVLVFLVGYAEQILVGSSLGSTSLGIYVLAFNLATWPVTMISQPLRNVVPAVLSRLQAAPDAMASTFVLILGAVAAVAFPMCLLLSAAAPQLVVLVYGEPWAAAGPVLRVLALVAVLRIFFELCYDYLVVLRQTAPLLRVQLVWLLFLVPALWWGAGVAGLAGVAAGQLAVVALVVLPSYTRLVVGSGVELQPLVRAARRPCLVAAGFAAPVGALSLAGVGAGTVCAAAGLAGVASLVLLGLPYRGWLQENLGRTSTPVVPS